MCPAAGPPATAKNLSCNLDTQTGLFIFSIDRRVPALTAKPECPIPGGRSHDGGGMMRSLARDIAMLTAGLTTLLATAALAVPVGTTLERAQALRAMPLQVTADGTVSFDTVLVGYTEDDLQHSGTTGRQVVLDSTYRTHVVWTEFVGSDPTVSRIRYNTIFGGAVELGLNGCIAREGARSLYPSLAIADTTPILVNGESADIGYNPVFNRDSADCDWLGYIPTVPLGSYLTTRVVTQWIDDTLVTHYSSVGNDLLYWREAEGNMDGYVPVAIHVNPQHALAVSPVSAKVALVYARSYGHDLFYRESDDNGRSWLAGNPGPEHGVDSNGTPGSVGLTAAYDFNDVLHLVYQKTIEGTLCLVHWSPATGLNTVVEANWDDSCVPSGSWSVGRPQLAVGTGTRLNNLYLIWEQYGGTQSAADTSAAGVYNAGIYLAVSEDAGTHWDRGRNLLDAPSPGCSGDCQSEVSPSIAPFVDSLVRILYIRDLEPNSFALGLTNNPVYYMELETPAVDSVPIMTGTPADLGTVFIGDNATDTVNVPVQNIGTADLEFTFSDTMSWLRFVGSPSMYSGTLPSSGSDQIPLILDATGLEDGTYNGTIAIAANDPAYDGAEITIELIKSSTVLADFRFGTIAGTDCWGWVGPDGTEYAIMGVEEGIAFVNATTLQKIQIIPGPGPCGASWRDIKTYRHYCYAVSECSGTNQGMMIIDLQYLPDSVHYVGSFIGGGHVTAHNLTIDTATGFAYPSGSGNGIRVVSLADPEAPVEYPTVQLDYVHDAFARNDTVWAAEPSTSSYSMWDLSDKNNAQQIVRWSVPGGGYAHNIWPSDDGRYAVTTEETPQQTVKIWDLQNLSNIQLRGQYLAASELAHNVHIRGNYMVLSHYESGVVVVDFSDPDNPTEVAAFDTFPEGESGGFEGCWGAYPFTPSGHVYASNLDGHFFILQFEEYLGADADGDGVPDVFDNCPQVANADQADADGDSFGDACDACPAYANPDQIGCPHQGDFEPDGFITALDLSAVIDALFVGGPDPQDPDCPTRRFDFDCDSFTTTLDLTAVIDYVYASGPGPCDPCAL
jgi:choice-of-anchor B domain-containing protein